MSAPAPDGAARSPDVGGAAAAVVALSSALLSFPLLEASVTGLADTACGSLLQRATVARLWVFFVLLPALLTFIGIGFPSFARAMLALLRGTLEGPARRTVVALCTPAAVWPLEAWGGRNGSVGLAIWVAVAFAWMRPSLTAAVRARWMMRGLAAAAAASAGFAWYQWQLVVPGGTVSQANAPTLFLLAFYAAGSATVLGILPASTSRLFSAAAVTGLFGTAWWLAQAFVISSPRASVFASLALAGAFSLTGFSLRVLSPGSMEAETAPHPGGHETT